MSIDQKHHHLIVVLYVECKIDGKQKLNSVEWMQRKLKYRKHRQPDDREIVGQHQVIIKRHQLTVILFRPVVLHVRQLLLTQFHLLHLLHLINNNHHRVLVRMKLKYSHDHRWFIKKVQLLVVVLKH